MEKIAKDCYRTFSEILPEDKFMKLFDSVEKQTQKEFARACLMHQRAKKCKSCDSDICLALLCSAVDAAGKKTMVAFCAGKIVDELGKEFDYRCNITKEPLKTCRGR